eukprot:5256907-Alexandrium_andersonii.AAC.1
MEGSGSPRASRMPSASVRSARTAANSHRRMFEAARTQVGPVPRRMRARTLPGPSGRQPGSSPASPPEALGAPE